MSTQTTITPTTMTSEQLVQIASEIAGYSRDRADKIRAASCFIHDMFALGKGDVVETACDLVLSHAAKWGSKGAVFDTINPETARTLYTMIENATTYFPYDAGKTASAVTVPMTIELLSRRTTVLEPRLPSAEPLELSFERGHFSQESYTCIVPPFLFEHRFFDDATSTPQLKYDVLNGLLHGRHGVIDAPPVNFAPGVKREKQFLLLAYLISGKGSYSFRDPRFRTAAHTVAEAVKSVLEFLLVNQEDQFRIRPGPIGSCDDALQSAYTMAFYADVVNRIRAIYESLGRQASARIMLVYGATGIDEVRVDFENVFEQDHLRVSPQGRHVQAATEIAKMTSEMGFASNEIFLGYEDGESIIGRKIGDAKGIDQRLLEMHLKTVVC